MATLLVETDIDVISKQRELVTEALGENGVYLRLKDTLEELMDDGEVKGVDRAKLISETLASMTASITANSMSTALQWGTQEKELALKKEELEYQLDILKLQADKLEIDTDGSLADKQLKQAQLLRVYGTKTTDAEGNVTSLGDNGREYETIEGIKQDTANKKLQEPQIISQTEEVQARTHKLVADTYVNHGLFTGYTITDSGINGATKVATGYKTLSDMNKSVAVEQAKGYAWNAWANAASSGSSMIGTLIAAEIPDLDPTTYLNTWQTAVGKLNGVTEADVTI